MLQANQRIIEFLFWLRNLWSHLDKEFNVLKMPQYVFKVDIFSKIVRNGRHWDESCNEWRYDTINYIFWRQLSQCEIAPIWQLPKYVHFKYILWHFEYIFVHVITIKKNIIVDWILCPGKNMAPCIADVPFFISSNDP
jgi:hypothetical protein